MKKLGVYVANHNNPMFLRMCLLQIANQTRKPDVLAIHMNNQPNSSTWAVRDIIPKLRERGTVVIGKLSPGPIQHPDFHLPPLEILFEQGCELFTKFDHDDFFYEEHIESLEKEMTDDVDVVAQKYFEALIIPQDAQYQARMTEMNQNPTLAMSDAILFNRVFAEQYIKDMKAAATGWPDDEVMAETMRKFRVKRYGCKPTCCYVIHGTNTSSSWIAEEERRRQQSLKISNERSDQIWITPQNDTK